MIRVVGSGKRNRRENMGVLDKFNLDSKVVVVTGASSGLGSSFVLLFAEAGANIAMGARRIDRLEALQDQVKAAGRSAVSCRTDVAVPEDCAALADLAFEQFGRIDVLINSAGIGASVPASREAPEDFRKVIEVNLMGSYWMAQACAKYMSTGSSIINIGSVLGFTSAGLPQAAYAASKSGLIGLTRDLAQQWSGRKGIRVNAIAPGFFPTEMTDELKPGYLEDILERRVPMKRLGELDECAAVAVFLASEAASFITGVCIPVDGGLLTN
jgi:NAD(P)-dependent dehydrogenase (short-subunit alcohol dehydrogenase family)